ncbi:hypothetical protein PITCH_A570009 [uncultured Desulfobacterium sp.]|uniref:Uncharacterized protein n=1 Tax=uncultured Desulfobacterium sp. TaxID=201089 RepID=A0A445N0X2_9BACT|nr:hypothetical protein PITCH_A570009 [uncultured Desulfobacterium sp.]
MGDLDNYEISRNLIADPTDIKPMTLDKNEFFRQATMLVCGSLAIETAMWRCLQYVGGENEKNFGITDCDDNYLEQRSCFFW